MYCRNCGKEIDDKAVICPNCGVAQIELNLVEVKPVNGMGITGFVIGLLSLFLGALYCIPPIVGIVISGIGISRSTQYRLNGFAVTGLILSIIALLIWGSAFIVVLSSPPGTFA